jgi:hypothetical protein
VVSLPQLPVVGGNSGTNATIFIEDLITLQVTQVRRDVDLSIAKGPGLRWVTWRTIANVTNELQYSTNVPVVWKPLASVLGDGQFTTVNDRTPKATVGLYRVVTRY